MTKEDRRSGMGRLVRSLLVGIGLSVGLGLFVSWARAPSEVSYGDGDEVEDQKERRLTDFSRFRFRPVNGWVEVIRDGKVIEEKVDSDFARLLFTVIDSGAGEGVLLGNSGTVKVSLSKTSHAYTFTEETLTGNIHVLTVTDEWDGTEDGFRSKYIRNRTVAGVGGEVLVRSTYPGVARPEP